MQQKQSVVSITSQGQLTIPKALLKVFGISKAVKAVIWQSGDRIMVEPKTDFWSLAGSLKSKVKLSDSQLRKARLNFGRKWARHV